MLRTASRSWHGQLLFQFLVGLSVCWVLSGWGSILNSFQFVVASRDPILIHLVNLVIFEVQKSEGRRNQPIAQIGMFETMSAPLAKQKLVSSFAFPRTRTASLLLVQVWLLKAAWNQHARTSPQTFIYFQKFSIEVLFARLLYIFICVFSLKMFCVFHLGQHSVTFKAYLVIASKSLFFNIYGRLLRWVCFLASGRRNAPISLTSGISLANHSRTLTPLHVIQEVSKAETSLVCKLIGNLNLLCSNLVLNFMSLRTSVVDRLRIKHGFAHWMTRGQRLFLRFFKRAYRIKVKVALILVGWKHTKSVISTNFLRHLQLMSLINLPQRIRRFIIKSKAEQRLGRDVVLHRYWVLWGCKLRSLSISGSNLWTARSLREYLSIKHIFRRTILLVQEVKVASSQCKLILKIGAVASIIVLCVHTPAHWNNLLVRSEHERLARSSRQHGVRLKTFLIAASTKGIPCWG